MLSLIEISNFLANHILAVISFGVFMLIANIGTIVYSLWRRRSSQKLFEAMSTKVAILESQNIGLNDQILSANQKLDCVLKEKEALLIEETQAKVRLQALEEKTNFLEEAKTRLFSEFELSASKLFEAKQQKFSEQSSEKLEHLISPFREQLKGLYAKVETTYEKENDQRNQLAGHIHALQKQTIKVSEDANNLAKALRGDNKVQGDWGEVILERILESAGLQAGREFHLQNSFNDPNGNRKRPDVIIDLPKGKQVVVDAKVSLKDFEQYRHAVSQEDREIYLKKHLDSISRHIKSLSTKRYHQIDRINSLEFVLAFIPVENAYQLALQNDPELFEKSLNSQVVIAGPSTLMIILRIINTLWEQQRQEENAVKIAQSAGSLYDQFCLFAEALSNVGDTIKKSQNSYEQAMNRLSLGRGNLIRKIEHLKEMGAKTTRNIPEKVLESAQTE